MRNSFHAGIAVGLGFPTSESQQLRADLQVGALSQSFTSTGPGWCLGLVCVPFVVPGSSGKAFKHTMTSMIRTPDRFRHYLQRCTRCAPHSWRQQQHAVPNDGSGSTCRGSALRSFFRDRSCRRQAAFKVFLIWHCHGARGANLNMASKSRPETHVVNHPGIPI